jgi:release factor glutamine methyltransferase
MLIGEATRDAALKLAAAGSEDARLEAEVLLAHALRIDRTHLLAELQATVSPEALALTEAMLTRRLAHEPLAYIVGYREFYGVEIICGPGALIPRPETEMLVELALAEITRRGETLRIADVGSGSGAIAVAVCLCAPTVSVVAIERSALARSVARTNIDRHHVESRIELRSGDLLEGLGVFDVIVANLPYVSELERQALPPEIREHEPREALVGGPAGTEVIERLLVQVPEHLAPGGVLACEVGAAQGDRLAAEAGRRFPDARACVKKDLAGHDRMLEVRRQGGG